MRALIETIFAREDGAGSVARPPPERVDWVCLELDDFLARASLRAFAIVALSLAAVSLVAPLLVRRFGALASLPLALRIEALERFERSALAPALLAVKALASIHYYEHPDAAREIGFDGECLVPITRLPRLTSEAKS